MKVRAGVSFEGPGNLWDKESVEDDTENYPEVSTLPLSRQAMYVRVRLEQRLLDFRWFKGNITQETHTLQTTALDALAERYLARADTPS